VSSDAYPRPGPNEHSPYYAKYVVLVPDGDLLDTMTRQLDESWAFFSEIGEGRGDHAYAPGKWTIREVLGHLIDAERIFGYRVLRIARGDQTPLPGFDENAYVPESLASGRTLVELAEEFAPVRRSHLALLRTLTPEMAARLGTASDAPVTVRAIAWIMAGHAAHHMGIVRERYLQDG
jgi:hypothetical protein